MRIGVDAKWLFSGNPSGRVVIRNYLEFLIRDFPENEYFVFLKHRDRGRKFPWQSPRIHLLYCRGESNMISNLLVIPWKARKLNLDVALFQYFAPFRCRFKTVVFIHDVIFKSHPEYFTLCERLYFWPMKFLARRTDRIITISQSEKKRITESRFAPESRIDFIYHGVNPKFKPKDLQDQTRLQDITSPYALPDRFLLYVGRLNKRKNLSNLLRAIGLLKDRQIKLVLAGTPWGRMFNLERMIMELGLADRVIVTGFVPDEDLPALYSRATVFCYVSFDEGFGLPPLEAMASGLPVVLADTAVLREVCGGAGNYADPKRPEDIAGQIDGLLENQDLYEEKKNAGLEWARRFRWSDSAERLMKILDCLLEGG